MNEEDLFVAALEKPPSERAAFLAEACGEDLALRQRLEALLNAHDRAGDFLSNPVVGSGTGTEEAGDAAQPVDPRSGEAGPVGAAALLPLLAPPGRPDSLGRLGHYEVLEVLG